MSTVLIVALGFAFLVYFSFPVKQHQGWYITSSETSETGRFIEEAPAGQFNLERRWPLESKESAFHGVYTSDIPANVSMTLAFKGDFGYRMDLTGLAMERLSCDTAIPSGRQVNDSRVNATVNWSSTNECRFMIRTNMPLTDPFIAWTLRPYSRPFNLDFAATMETTVGASVAAG